MKKKIVVFTGAGISKESGVDTFRDAVDGLWENHKIEEVCTIDGWRKDREKVLNFYNDRRRQMPTVEPNDAHKALARLEEDFDVTIVTQNVDDLHERAGSTNVIHLHGELLKARSTIDTNAIQEWKSDLVLGDLCDKGHQLRPHIVWFGEEVPNIIPAVEIVKKADVLIIVGTSLNVYPAAGLSHEVKLGTPIYLIDPTEVNTSNLKNVTHLKLGAGVGLTQLADKLMRR